MPKSVTIVVFVLHICLDYALMLMLGSLFFVLLLFFRRLFSSVPLLAKLN